MRPACSRPRLLAYNRVVPLYSYVCLDCGAELEVLHRAGQERKTCGLDCRRKGPGAFGRGRVARSLAAPSVAAPGGREIRGVVADVRELMRQEGLRRLGGELTERDLDRLRDKGIGVFRRDGAGRWTSDGGAPSLPERLEPDEGER